MEAEIDGNLGNTPPCCEPFKNECQAALEGTR